jgi:signal transduction histidine kinase
MARNGAVNVMTRKLNVCSAGKEAISVREETEPADALTVNQLTAATSSRPLRGQTSRRVLGPVLILFVVTAVVVTATVALSSDTATRGDIVGQAIRLSVTLLIPAAVMIAYWFIVQTQVRTAKSDLQKRLDSGQDLIARVSHQLRDQLTVIYGFSEALLDSDMSDQAEVRDVVTILNAEAVDLSRIVDDLVSAAEFEAGAFRVSFSKFDPSVEVERVVAPFRRRGHEISVDCWSGTAVSDPIRFRQVVRTLLSNATEHGGQTIGFVGELSNGSFLCTVVDDGDGMSSDIEGQFFGSPADELKATSDVEGSGLGLTVSHAIVHQLGGRLMYQRSTDLTMVTMALPTAGWPDMQSAETTPTAKDVTPDGDAASTSMDDSATEPDPDVDQETEDMEAVIESVDDASGAGWSISFDTQNNQASEAAEEESDLQPEEPDVVEASASS